MKRIKRWARDITVAVVAGALAGTVVMAVASASEDKTPAPTTSTTTTTTPPTTTTRPDPSPGQDWPTTFALPDADRLAVLDALMLVKDHAGYMLDDMREHEGWELYPCGAMCADSDALARTTAEPCTTYVDMQAIDRDADQAGIPRAYWLAATLVHELGHCDPDGQGDEWHSLTVQLEFVRAWPEPQRTNGVRAIEQLATQVDEQGHWREDQEPEGWVPQD